ncbi:MAG: flagellar biosynthesis anti-sigma factor FlgM [Planctomycetota bacterium]|jgi:negative regulator of flagellin synthesis FlgM
MTSIHGIQPPVPPKAVDATGPIVPGNAKLEPASISDTIEISNVAKLTARIQEIPEVRTELIEQVRAEIATGTYETPERLEIAVERLIVDLFPEV